MSYRDNGAIGAILDEYEKSIKELKSLLTSVSSSELVTMVDLETKDEDCRSIQTILTHVVSAGYNYIVVIRQHLGEDIDYYDKAKLESIAAYQSSLDSMFFYAEKLFKNYPKLEMDHFDDNKIEVRWDNTYDLEQLFEHAIVHVLRHRRQIERFLIRLRK